MIEFLQPFVEVLARIVPGISSSRERTRSANLGAELFLLYVQLNEALALAEDIVNSLEVYVDRMSEHVRTGTDPYARTAGEWVSSNVREQIDNLAGIKDRMRKLRWDLQVLEGEANNNLRFLIAYKMSALSVLADAVDRNRFPVLGRPQLADPASVPPGVELLNDAISLGYYPALAREIADNSVAMDAPWDAAVLTVIKRYLEVRDPRRELDDIRTSMELIRAALEANFSVRDILLRAGDPRARNRRKGFG